MPKKEDVIQTKTDTRRLKTDLTPDEITEATEELVRQLDDHNALENELAELKAEYKAKLASCEAAIQLKTQLVRNKYEHREISVNILLNYTKGTYQMFRTDTSECIEDRKMTSGERQQEIHFTDKDAEKPKD